ncbi:hypothetical protein [Candidatus Nanohalococcus occultus]|uniref:HEPN domain-containing protein n=1 Tax=Candidatus Nanohalococcus occultus TaxID=2978047 RepID=A0ABY8CE30_9ARCH|nr:hypothetical protein SVXNc_0451 [Candidatus Nanohaloarchaeota archaeon SVXNc]
MSEYQEIKQDVVRSKDMNERSFQVLTKNFYVFRAAIRYFAVRQGLSFTSSKISDRFPITASSAGSGLNVLEELEVVESRTSSSKSRYMPKDVDIERLKLIEEVLQDSFEIESFWKQEN